MASHMSVQKMATQRNALAEMLIDYILQRFVETMYEEGYTTQCVAPEQQKPFSREDCSEVYDHYFLLPLSEKLDPQKRTLHIWAQTTCYKGNTTGKPEPNKTYEIRETLVEALTLRKWLISENQFFRTLHFTLGPSNYTYGWFMPAKENAFDLSLYPKFDSEKDIFDVLLDLGKQTVYQFDFYEKLDELCETLDNDISKYINKTVEALKNYFISGFPSSADANRQTALLQNLWNETQELRENSVHDSTNNGMDIKGKSVKLLDGEQINDPVLGNTLKRLIQTNPFLPVAIDALNDWENWSITAFHCDFTSISLYDYLLKLWQSTTNIRYVSHRLLMRLYTEEAINYIQDINVDGVDEHNLYNGNHTFEQASAICHYLVKCYNDNGITTAHALYCKLISHQAKNLVNSSLKFERINGTSLKPSFFYLEEFLKPKYELVTFEEATLPAPIAYYSKFADNLGVKPYDNLKVIRTVDSHKNLAIVKGKFFRQPEFPRRVKEESYVGITARYDLKDGTFVEKYNNLPFIMFIDMAENYTPPAFTIKRIINYGWTPFFQLSNLVEYLESLEAQNE